MISLGLESVKGEHLFASFIPASNLHWIFAGLPMLTHVCIVVIKKWPDTAAYFNRRVPSLSHCFGLSTTAALSFNWDWSNEQWAKFLRHIWQSVFITKLKLAASFSSSTADGPNTGILLTTWQRMEGFCHDCLRYPLSLSPKMIQKVTESCSWWSAFSCLMFASKYSTY